MMIIGFIMSVLLLLIWGAAYRRTRRAEAKYPPRGRFIDAAQCRLHYEETGNGVPVVLLHGTGGSFEDYSPRIREALSSDFRVIAIDRPGHGYSARPRGDIGAPVVQATLIHDALQAIGAERAIIVGHSWSGALAAAYAVEFPSDALGLVLLQGTFYREPPLVTGLIRLLAAPLVGPLVAHTAVPWTARGPIRWTLQRAFAPDALSVSYLARAQAMWARPGQARAIAVDTLRRHQTIDMLSLRYTQLACPVELVVGGSDHFIDPGRHSLRFARGVPNARVRLVEGAGHQLPLTHPDVVVDAVRTIAQQIGELKNGAPRLG